MIRLISKILFFIVIEFYSNSAIGQYYKHSLGKEKFQPLTVYTEYVFSQPWDEERIKLPIGFDFKLYGELYDSMIVANGRINFIKNIDKLIVDGDTVCRIQVYTINLKDKGSTNSESPVRYHCSGLPGERVFCLEINDALIVGSMHTLDFQVLLYESTNEIIMHYDDVTNSREYLPGSLAYKIGIGKFIAPNTILEGVALYGTNLDDRLSKKDFLSSLLWQQVYDSLKISFTNQDNFHFSNLTETQNLNVINETASNIQMVIGGFAIGTNYFLDKGVSSKYKFKSPVYLKGVSFNCHGNYNKITDSLIVQVNKIGIDNFPSTVLTEKKVAISCLNLKGKLNDVSFDSQVLIEDSCMISFILPEYVDDSENFFYFYWIYSTDPLFDPYTTNMLLVNNKWYSVLLDRLVSERFTDGNRAYDSLNLSIFPIVNNFNFVDKPVEENINCAILSRQAMQETKHFEIFPNPVIKDYRVEISSSSPISKIEIIGINSESKKSIDSKSLINSNSFSVEGLTNGVYFIYIYSGDDFSCQKLVIIK